VAKVFALQLLQRLNLVWDHRQQLEIATTGDMLNGRAC